MIVSDRVLRDHSQPCKTCGFLQPLNIDGVMVGVEACVECGGAGGREVTIDASAAVEAVRGRGDYGPEVIVTLVLDAALGVSE